jgi:hypothetical protein
MRKGELEGLVGRIRQVRRAAAAAAAPDGDAGSLVDLDRVGSLEARVAHLERLLEGFQDSVHREADRHAKMIADLQAHTQPGAISAALAEDARNRGL